MKGVQGKIALDRIIEGLLIEILFALQQLKEAIDLGWLNNEGFTHTS
jgi:hypothetical protein